MDRDDEIEVGMRCEVLGTGERGTVEGIAVIVRMDSGWYRDVGVDEIILIDDE